jgi:hypothetical protein
VVNTGRSRVFKVKCSMRSRDENFATRYFSARAGAFALKEAGDIDHSIHLFGTHSGLEPALSDLNPCCL